MLQNQEENINGLISNITCTIPKIIINSEQSCELQWYAVRINDICGNKEKTDDGNVK